MSPSAASGALAIAASALSRALRTHVAAPSAPRVGSSFAARLGSIASSSSSSSPSSKSMASSTLTAALRCRRLFSSSSTSSSPSSSTVLSETSSPTNRDRIPPGVALLTVDRAAQLNALSSQVMRDLTTAAAAADADPRVRAIVVAGAGDRAFAAGADVKELAGITHDEAKKSRLLADWDRLSRVRVPLVAAVRGLALGGGFEVALMCDLIVAGDDARFALPEVKGLGVIPGMGATQRLPRAIGKYRAMEMVLLGKSMSAEEAREAGLVARVVSPADRTVEAALELAGEIARSPPLAVAAAKRSVSHALEAASLSSGLEAEHAEFWACFGTAEQREGMSAFLEKREAKWPTII